MSNRQVASPIPELTPVTTTTTTTWSRNPRSIPAVLQSGIAALRRF